MRIALLFYGEYGIDKNYLDNYNRFLNNYDCDVFFSISDKTHYDTGWKKWEHSELYENIFHDIPETKGVHISHIPCVAEEYEWSEFLNKNKLQNITHGFGGNGSLAYDTINFSELKLDHKLDKTSLSFLKKELKDVNEVFHPKDLKYPYKIPFFHKELDIHKKYTGFKMIERFLYEEEEDVYDLVIMCNINQLLPKIFLEKITNSFALSESIYFFPTSYSYVNNNFALGNYKNMKVFSELWLKLREYQYHNLSELKSILMGKSDNPYMLENLHYFHVINNNINMLHLANLDISNLPAYYKSLEQEY